MSLPVDSTIVCQIPDCTTTRGEIEFELKTFLSSYCTTCKQDRNGKLCGCAFPCSLTFRAHMLSKIHDLLGIQKPPARKAIQVCFKHPDLLKQAREACVAKRRELCTSARARRFDRPTSSSASTAAVAATFSNPPSGQIEAKEGALGNILNLDTNFKLDGPSTSSATHVPSSSQPGVNVNQQTIQDQDFSSFDDFAGSKFREIEKSKTEMTKIQFNPGQETSTDSSEDETNFMKGLVESKGRNRLRPNDQSPVCEGDINSIPEQVDDFFGDDTFSPIPDEPRLTSSVGVPSKKIKPNPRQGNGAKKLFRIKYENYYESILMRELFPLLHKSFLNDVTFICRDGQVPTNSLLLCAMSGFLRDLLSEVQTGEKSRLILLPDVQASDLETFLGLIFVDQDAMVQVDERDVKKIQTLAALFKIETIPVVTKRPGRPKGSTNKSKISRIFDQHQSTTPLNSRVLSSRLRREALRIKSLTDQSTIDEDSQSEDYCGFSETGSDIPFNSKIISKKLSAPSTYSETGSESCREDTLRKMAEFSKNEASRFGSTQGKEGAISAMYKRNYNLQDEVGSDIESYDNPTLAKRANTQLVQQGQCLFAETETSPDKNAMFNLRYPNMSTSESYSNISSIDSGQVILDRNRQMNTSVKGVNPGTSNIKDLA